MNDPWQTAEGRLLELLADRAAFGLEPEEVREFRQLLQTMPDFDTQCMERAAATVPLAMTPVETMPAPVRARIQASGLRHLRAASPE